MNKSTKFQPSSFCYSANITVLAETLTKTVSVAPSAIMFTLGVLGNVLAIIMLFRHASQHKWKIFYRLVGALALTDLFGIMTTAPIAFITYSNNFRWVGGTSACDYLSFMLIFASMATMSIITAMSFDRYLAIKHPFFYNASHKKRRVHVMLVGLWVFSALIAALPVMGFGHNIRHFPCTWCLFDYFGTTSSDVAYSVFYAILGIITIITSSTMNTIVIIAVARGAIGSAPRGSVKSIKGKRRAKRNEIMTMIFLVAVLLTFAICWSPFMVRVLRNTSGAPHAFKADILALRLASWNQILDPWIYILLRKEMLVRFYNFYHKHRYGSTPSIRENSTDSTNNSSNGSFRDHARLENNLSKSQMERRKQLLRKMESLESNTTQISNDG